MRATTLKNERTTVMVLHYRDKIGRLAKHQLARVGIAGTVEACNYLKEQGLPDEGAKIIVTTSTVEVTEIVL
jgi:hypothetical protein